MTRVLVVASSAVVRAGLESILSARPGFEVVTGVGGTSAGFTGLLAAVEDTVPDVVLMDVDLTIDPSTPLFPVLAADAPTGTDGPVFVLLLENAEANIVGEAVHAGAHAVLPRDAEAREIQAAVEAAAAGLIALPVEAAAALLPARASRPIGGGETLTPREIEVLRLMAEGSGNKQIARRLGISEHTIKFHVGSILAKLGASSRTEAVTMGVRQALIMV